LCGLIEGEDKFHCLAALGTVDGGLLTGADGRDGFFEIRAMPGVADRLRIVGACAAAFSGRSNDRGIGGQGLFEFEGGELVVAEDGGAGRAMDADLGRETSLGPFWSLR